MITEMVLPTEGFSADVARVWPFVGVSPFVNEEVVRFRKLTLTKLANELLFGSLTGGCSRGDGNGRGLMSLGLGGHG